MDDIEITLQLDDINVEDDVTSSYVLPKASATTLGGIKIGSNINIDSNGVASVPVASTTTAGVVKAGSGISITSDGTISANGSGYVLPQATKYQLGGVYVDDDLDNSSLNPVQNSVVSTSIHSIIEDIDAIGAELDTLTTTSSTLTNSVSSLNSSLSTLSSAVSANSDEIDYNSANISSLSTSIANQNTAITNLTNNLNELGSQVSALIVNIDRDIEYSNIGDEWTAGGIYIKGKGFYAVMYINLEGSLTISSGSSVILYTLSNEYTPAYDAYGEANIVDGGLSVKVDSSNGQITLINNNSTSVNVGKIIAGVPLIYGSV